MVLIGYWKTGHMGYSYGSTIQTRQSGPNSAGGLDIWITFRNDSEKVIKYAYFSFYAQNGVGDFLKCRVRGYERARLEFTGPVQPGATANAHWENVWYNNNITTTSLNRIEIEYMDGTTESMFGKDVTIEDPPKGGCYVATAVYHSYDCPQVWTLRRFRDDTLGASWYGRAFVRLYYAVSPTLVRWFGETAWFQKLWRGPLDRLVAKLQAQGVEDTPYEDKIW